MASVAAEGKCDKGKRRGFSTFFFFAVEVFFTEKEKSRRKGKEGNAVLPGIYMHKS